MIKKLIPTMNRILVRKAELDAKTASGIILQNKATLANLGEVLATGPGEFDHTGNRIPLQVVQGNNVLLPEYGG